MLSFPVFANQNSHQSASLAPVALRPLHFRHREKECIRHPDLPSFFSCSCALFHFPYPVTPLLACPPWRDTLTKTAGCIPTIPIMVHPEPSRGKRALRLSQRIVALSFHALTNCPFYIPFVLTFMHRMGGVQPNPIIHPASFVALPILAVRLGGLPFQLSTPAWENPA